MLASHGTLVADSLGAKTLDEDTGIFRMPDFEYAFVDSHAAGAWRLFAGYALLIILEAAFILGGIGHWRIAGLVSAAELALFLTCVPMVVTIVGMYRAVTAWQWPLWRAGLTFLGPFMFLIAAVVWREAALLA